MQYNITGTFKVGPTVLDHDLHEFTLRRYAASESQRDKIVNAMNALSAVTVVVEQMTK